MFWQSSEYAFATDKPTANVITFQRRETQTIYHLLEPKRLFIFRQNVDVDWKTKYPLYKGSL